jgi:hypothetical protein
MWCCLLFVFIFCNMRSSATLYARSHARAHRATLHTLALRPRAPHSARFCSSAIELTLVRSSALDSEPHVTFLGHLSLLPISFLTSPYSLPHPFHSSLIPNTNPNHHFTAQNTPITSTHPPATATAPAHTTKKPFPFSLFLSIFSQTPSFQNPHFVPIFYHLKAQSIQDCVLSILCWFIVFLQGVGVDFKKGFQTLVLETPTTCLIKFPNQFQHA